MIGILGGVCASFFILIKKFKYKPRLFFHDSIIKEIGKYSFINYVSGFIGSLPILLLPLMITNSIHPEMTAYFYMAMMVANVLFIIPQAASSSLFAEGSYNEKSLKEHTRKAWKIIGILAIPSIILTIILGKDILLLIGKDYSSLGYMLLNYLALSCIFISINSIFSSLFKVEHRINELLIVNVISAFSILGLSYLFMNNGLNGLGLAWLIGQGITAAAYILTNIIRKKNSHKK
jgi:O-antigen/teichoic acid export membrane protein